MGLGEILLLQLKRIGDLILTTPAIRCLREAFPQARLTLVVDSSCQGLLDALAVDECWVHNKRGANPWITKKLIGFRADWCLDFSGTDRSAFFTFASLCKRRATFKRFRKKFLRRFIYTDFVGSQVSERHTADHYTDLLQPLGITRENVALDLRLPEAAVDGTKNLLTSANITSAYAVIHAGTARDEKYWLPERWAQVMNFLSTECGLALVLTGSDDPAEQSHLVTIKNLFCGNCIDLSGKTQLLELAALIRGARLFCGVDTAAMHLAGAMGTPTVALFGPTNPYHWRPRHTKSVILRADATEPFFPKQQGGSMEHIATAAVLAGIRRLL